MENNQHPSSDDSQSLNPKRKITIRDVARVAGVSPSTVSRTFARPGRVSSETAATIQKVADDLGYRADAIRSQRGISSQLNGQLAIVVADLSNPVYAEYTRSAQHECFSHNLGLLVIDSEENRKVERSAIQLAMPHVDGIILASSRISDNGIRKLAELKPLIAINRSIRGIQSIIADTSKGLEDAVQCLSAMKHTAITYLSGPESSWQEGTRRRTLEGICAARNIRLNRIQTETPSFVGGYQCRETFLRNRTSAVIAYNDAIAIGFITAIKARGIEVPEDVSVIGIDDVQVSSLITPALSSIRIPRMEMGASAVDEIIQYLHHTKRSHSLKPLIFKSVFIQRASITRCK